MKTIGKIAALAMTLALACVLSACGGSSSSSAASSASASASSSASASASSESASSSSASESTTASASSAAAATEFQIGTIAGDTYANEFFGIKFTLPAGWTFADAEKLASLNAQIGSILDNETVSKALDSGAVFIDMYAETEGGTNVNVAVEHASSAAANAFEPADYLAAAVETAKEQLTAAGITVKDTELLTYKNDSGEFAALKLTLEMGGTPFYEEMICVKQDDYFLNLTTTALKESDLDTILKSVAKQAA